MLFKIDKMEQLPSFHDDMLIVKVRPNAATIAGVTPMGTFALGGGATPMAFSPGISLLSLYERSGLIKRVVPLARSEARFAALGPFPAVATMMGAASIAHGGQETSSTGVSILELQTGANLEQLQLSLGADPSIEFVSRVPVRYLMAGRKATGTGAGVSPGGGATVAATPPSADTMWNLRKIRWKQAHDNGLDLAANVSVAVLDSGIDLDHPDLPGSDITYVHEYPESQAATSERDIIGHGTHVAGTIRALINNQTGINGISECRLSVYKIFGDEPSDRPVLLPFPNFPYYVDPILYRAALAAALDAGVQVINLSIGGPGQPDPQERALFQALIDSGVAVVAAMGNENTSRLSYPAAIPGVIAVGATAADDSRADFSNFGSHIALSAPGVAIWSTLPTHIGQTGFYAVRGSGSTWTRGAPMQRETDYDAWQGTSMASPHVAAAAALAIAKYGSLSSADIKDKLQSAVDKVPAMNGLNFNKEFGAGRLNLMKL